MIVKRIKTKDSKGDSAITANIEKPDEQWELWDNIARVEKVHCEEDAICSDQFFLDCFYADGSKVVSLPVSHGNIYICNDDGKTIEVV